MNIKKYKFIQKQREDKSRYFHLHVLTMYGLLWSPIGEFETFNATKAKEVDLNKEGLCLIEWEFLDRSKDCNDWTGT